MGKTPKFRLRPLIRTLGHPGNSTVLLGSLQHFALRYYLLLHLGSQESIQLVVSDRKLRKSCFLRSISRKVAVISGPPNRNAVTCRYYWKGLFLSPCVSDGTAPLHSRPTSSSPTLLVENPVIVASANVVGSHINPLTLVTCPCRNEFFGGGSNSRPSFIFHCRERCLRLGHFLEEFWE